MVETNDSISQLSPQFRANISMAVRVLAQRSAIEIVNHHLRARGLIWEIVALAHDYIAAHPEPIAEAKVTVEERRPECFFGKRAARSHSSSICDHSSAKRRGSLAVLRPDKLFAGNKAPWRRSLKSLSWRRSEFLLSVVGSTLKSRQDTSSGLFV